MACSNCRHGEYHKEEREKGEKKYIYCTIWKTWCEPSETCSKEEN